MSEPFVPHSYQKIMLDFGMTRDEFAFYVSCGMGKTVVLLKLLEQWLIEGKSRGMLVVAPIRVCSITYPDQVTRWDHSSWMRVIHLRTKEGLAAWHRGEFEIALVNPEQLQKLCPILFKGKTEIPADTFVWDECFPPGTLVDTPSGPVPIEEIKKSDCIFNVSGQDTVLATHRNEIYEATLILLTDGTQIISSRDHEFLTQRGWSPASSLRQGDKLSQRDSPQVRRMWGVVCEEGLPPKALLLNKMLGSMEDADTPSKLDGGEAGECVTEKAAVVRGGGQNGNGVHQEDNGSVSHEESCVCCKAERNFEEDRTQTKGSRGEWEATYHPTAISAVGTWGSVGRGVLRGAEEDVDQGVPEALQDRSGEPREENSDRGGWGEPQLCSCEVEGPKEGRQAGRIRVDSVEVLKQGDPRLERFRDANGRIYFYDLTVARHPSYSVRGCIVHNCSQVKNPASKRVKAITPYLHLFKQKLGLTGTPCPNTYLDLWNQAFILDGGQRLGKSFFHFRQTYFTSDFMGYTWTINPGAKEIIDAKLADLCLVMLGDDYLDLPTCNAEDIDVPLPPEAKALYRKMEKELLLQRQQGDVVALSAAALCGKLLQMTGGFVYDENGGVFHLHSAKLDALKKLRAKHKDEPMLILTSYNHETAAVLEAIPGAVEFHERDMAKWKRGEIKTWVGKCSQMSHGIDGMQLGGRIAVWYTPTWSWEAYTQTNARLVRPGQSYETTIYRLLVPDSIDWAVVEVVKNKSDTESGLLNALKILQKQHAPTTP